MPSDYASISEQNKADYGNKIRKLGDALLSKLYSDRSHFIYELLQNAEDALSRRARTKSGSTIPGAVEFRLYEDRLEFRHFGIPFGVQDVEAICGILDGTKAEDRTQIGRFGIGFKSVYAYTSSPEIHSGDEHFVIRDYVHPSAVAAVEIKEEETLLILPFDSSEVSAAKAFGEIAQRLKQLDAHTLLFLRYIESIHWFCDGDEEGQYSRKTTAVRRKSKKVALTTSQSNEAESWLVLNRPIPSTGVADLRVEIAFKLRRDPKTRSESIVSDDTSCLVVFFPTEKDTRLKFLIQGPYQTTPARDNIPHDSEWNVLLVNETALLLVDSLATVKELGLLSIQFLQTLPICAETSSIASVFGAFFEQTKKAFKEMKLIPSEAGGYLCAEEARIARSSGLRKLLSSKQLTQLVESEQTVRWITGDISPDKTPDLYNFLTGQLEISEVTPENFARLLTPEFLSNQSDDWMVRFYRFLLEQEALWREKQTWLGPGILRTKAIIRRSDDQSVVPFREDGLPLVYLPSNGTTSFAVVKKALADDPKALLFLKKLGLREPDIVSEVVEHVLPRYRGEQVTVREHEYIGDLRKILLALKSDSQAAVSALKSELSKSKFLHSKNASGHHAYQAPDDVYLQTPELETFFASTDDAWFADLPLAEDERGELFSRISIRKEPARIAFDPEFDRAEKRKLRNNDGSNRYETIIDYDLHGLEQFLARIVSAGPDIARGLSAILWRMLSRHSDNSEWFDGHYQYHYYGWKTVRFESRFYKRLSGTKWIPDCAGTLYLPFELSPCCLDPNLDKDLDLTAILRFLPDPPRHESEVAASLGIEVSDLEYLRTHRDAWQEFKRWNEERAAAERGSSDKASTASGTGSNVSPGAHNGASDSTKQRLHAPVFVAYSNEKSVGAAASAKEQNTETDRAGIDRVLEFERSQGRNPEEQAHNNEGFDIKSTDNNGEVMRFIEVKSLFGAWDGSGVALTRPQFAFANNEGEKFWLYVVECATSADFKIHRLNNPGVLVTAFIYNDSWRVLTEDTLAAQTS